MKPAYTASKTNNNLFSPTGRIDRKWYCINAVILEILFRLNIGLLATAVINIISFWISIFAMIFIVIFKVFNYKKRFFDIIGNKVHAWIMSFLYLLIGFIATIYITLLNGKVANSINTLSGTTIRYPYIPDYIGTEVAQTAFCVLCGIGFVISVTLICVKSKKENVV